MNRNLTGISVFLVALLFFGGLFFPESPIMWLASTSDGYAVVRAGIAAILIALLYTHPPRSKNFRLLLSVASLAFGTWAAILTMQSSMFVLDIFVFLQTAVVFAIAAIEFQPRSEQPHSSDDDSEEKQKFVIDPLLR